MNPASRSITRINRRLIPSIHREPSNQIDADVVERGTRAGGHHERGYEENSAVGDSVAADRRRIRKRSAMARAGRLLPTGTHLCAVLRPVLGLLPVRGISLCRGTCFIRRCAHGGHTKRRRGVRRWVLRYPLPPIPFPLSPSPYPLPP
jgi:hypothetical protein